MKYQFENEQITNCIKCPFCRSDLGDYFCDRTDRTILLFTFKGHFLDYPYNVPNWCPLVEVQDDK